MGTIGKWVAGILLGALLSGCGGSADNPPTAAAPGTTPDAAVAPNGKPSPSPAPKEFDPVRFAAYSAANTAAPAEVKRSEEYPPRVLLRTSLGTITLELDAKKAPKTVAHFLNFVERGHYDGTIFHEVIRDYMILGGGFTPELEEKEVGEHVRNEAHNGLTNVRGTIAMVRDPARIDSAGSQFFINVVDNPKLNHQGRTETEYGYCVFGKVVDGLDIVDKICQAPVKDEQEFHPLETVLILKAQRLK